MQDIDTGKLKLIAGDATRLDVHKLLAQEGQLDPRWKVVANLPFNITSEILRLLLPLGDILAEVFVMLQARLRPPVLPLSDVTPVQFLLWDRGDQH